MSRFSDVLSNVKTTLSQFSLFHVVPIVAGVICLVVVGFSAYGFLSAQDTYNSSYSNNVSSISKLEADLAFYEAGVDVDVEAVQASVSSAFELGSKVAQLQEMFWSIDIETQEDAYIDNIIRLMECFTVETGRGSDCWFMYSEGNAEEKGLNWQFLSDIKSAEESFPVVWVCKDSSQKIICLVDGMYDSEENVFYDVHVSNTQYGANTYMEYLNAYDTDSRESDGTIIVDNESDLPEGTHYEVGEDGELTIVDSNGNEVEGSVFNPSQDEAFADAFEQAVNDRADRFK